MEKEKINVIISLIIVVVCITGQVECIIKAVKCNWDPIGKAEVIYTVGACTGMGFIIGFINIEDN